MTNKKPIADMTDLELLDDTIKMIARKLKRKECQKEYRQSDTYKDYQKKRRQSDAYKDYQKDYQKKRQQSDAYKDYLKEYRQSDTYKDYQKEYRQSDTYKEYLRNRRKTDICYKLACNLRNSGYDAIKNNIKAGSFVRDLGCSLDEFKAYIASQFLPGMTWENWGHDTWHIDHIIPLNTFDLSDREQFLKAAHWSNQRPLWAEENLSRPKDGSDIVEDDGKFW